MAEDRPKRMSYPIPLPEDFEEGDDEQNGGVSAFAMFNHLLRHARWIVGVPLLAFILTALYINTRDQPYMAESRFMPSGSSDLDMGGDAGVFSQLNRLVGGGGRGSGDGMFYSFLVQSNAFLRQAAGTEYAFERATEEGSADTVQVSGTLAEAHGLQPPTEESNIRWSLGILKGMVSSRVDPGTGFVAITVEAPWPGLAVAVNERLLELVNEFNVEQRQVQAAQERQFVEQQMAETEAELRAAEAELVRFMEQNQRYEQSPRLRYEAMRLESEVDLKRSLYSNLARSYDQARINEVRNTPVVTIVERPEQTVGRPSRGNAPLRYGIMAAVIALLVTIGAIGVISYISRQSEEHPDDFEEFRRLAASSVPGAVRSRLPRARGRDNGADRGGAGVRTGVGAGESQGPPSSS